MWLVKASSFCRHHFSEVNSSFLESNAGQFFRTVGYDCERGLLLQPIEHFLSLRPRLEFRPRLNQSRSPILRDGFCRRRLSYDSLVRTVSPSCVRKLDISLPPSKTDLIRPGNLVPKFPGIQESS
jgi:hypothetical protein